MQVEPFPDGFNLLQHGCHVATLTRTEASALAATLVTRLGETKPFIPRPPLWMRLRDWWLARFPSRARRESVEAGRARVQRMFDEGKQPHLRGLP